MKFGLKQTDIDYLKKCISQFPEIEIAIIFGSRAIGNFKPGSDIDLCLKGKRISLDSISKIKYLLEKEGPLPYLVDVVSYSHIQSKELKKHIDTKGMIVFPS